MNKAKIIGSDGKIAGTIELAENVFGVIYRKEFMNEAMKEYLRKDFKASTKTKAEVSGGGKKPWRQKGTGRARAGSIRSPLWKGGGIIFGPKPRKKENTLTKKKKQLALRQALSYLNSENKIFFTENAGFSKTKEACSWLRESFKEGNKVLLVAEKLERNFLLPFRNIPGISFIRARDLNIKEVLYKDAVIFVGKALDEISRAFEKQIKINPSTTPFDKGEKRGIENAS
ncbi:MAG: 50S ribosomal protein L4 [Elusimicrobia bacterium CG08_land_8_20_14_0_20_44_26]|nr:MAG: 50S ribosomal protein L4 [Elusimicrobia bacterium CG08_land_8_20_14_0_20_44_26]